jgi:hypothetical protein
MGRTDAMDFPIRISLDIGPFGIRCQKGQSVLLACAACNPHLGGKSAETDAAAVLFRNNFQKF